MKICGSHKRKVFGCLLLAMLLMFLPAGCAQGAKSESSVLPVPESEEELPPVATAAEEEKEEIEEIEKIEEETGPAAAAAEEAGPENNAAPENRTDDIPRILCFGDSNTWGYDPANFGERYDENVRWTGILGARLKDRAVILEEGLNGRRTGIGDADSDSLSGLAVLEDILRNNAPSDIVIIMLGTNDCFSYAVESAEKITEGVEELVHLTRKVTQEVQGYEPKILIVSPVPVRIIDRNLDPETEYTKYVEEALRRSEALASLYEELAQREDCAFFDAGTVTSVSDLDGVHLTEKGHLALADSIMEILTEMLPGEGR